MPLLKILSNSEIAGFDSPPVFNHEERKRFFSLPSGFKQFWRKIRTTENQILFILQLGYFRSRQKFFAGHFHREDFAFEKRKVYENQGFQILPKAYIDTKLIEENWDDILRFVATIKIKRTSASQLFKRLNSYSNQHPLYQALKEFGKIIKTLFILRYVDNCELRQSIEKQLNKIEHAQRFAKAVAFGNGQEVSQAEKEDQEITAECRRLIENSVICWNYLYLTHKLTKAGESEKAELLKALKEGSIITWRHVNFYGEYDFSEDKLKDSIGFNLPEIVSWKMEEKREQIIPKKSMETEDYQKSYETFLPFGDF